MSSLKNPPGQATLALALAIFAWAPASAELDRFSPNITAKMFSPERLEKIGTSDFKFSGTGGIIDGPRQSGGEPIDYSSLLTDEAIETVFMNSLFNCFSSTRYCTPRLFRWDSKILPLSGSYEGDSLSRDEFEAISRILPEVLGGAGFSVPAVRNSDQAALVIFSGSIAFLKTKSGQIDDRHASRFFDELQRKSSNRNWFRFWRTDKFFRGETCFVSTKERVSGGRVYLFFHPDDLEECLPQQLLVAVGLNETVGYFPSVTGDDRLFKAATAADLFFLRALYDDEFPIGEDREKILAFFRAFLEKSRE